MILKNVIAEMRTAGKPVVKRLQEGKDFHVLAIGLEKDVTLKEHTTDIPAKLVVIKGKVIYKTASEEIPLELFEEHTIKVGELHSVTAEEDSVFLVIKG